MKSNKLNKKMKIILIIILICFIVINGIVINSKEQKTLKNKIVECYSEEVYNKLDEIVGVKNIKGNFSYVTTCKSLKLNDENYNLIDIKLDDNKKLIYIKVGDKFKYGDNSYENNKTTNNTSSKEDYEFETIKGYTTLQSLIMNIDVNTKYSKIKNMADYVGYYIKDMTQGEHYGLIKMIYNTGEKYYYNNYTESVMLIFDDYSGKKLSQIEYSVSSSSIKYTYYMSDKSNNFVYIPDEGNKKIDNYKEAFKYINDKVGYKG